MSNVLLVDTNFSSAPIYQYLIDSGHNVTVVGANPSDALAKSAVDYVNLDYSDIQKIIELVTERNIEYLIPGCNDRSYMVCAEINHDGRFPGIDCINSATIINNKEKFRSFAALNNLPIPQILNEQEIGTRWPVIVKPVDSFSGRGVTVIQEASSKKLLAAIDIARQKSHSANYIVEDFVEGQLFSHSAFIKDKVIIFDIVVEEYGTANPFAVDTSRVVHNFPQSILEKIRKDIVFIVNKLNLKDGLLHTQFIKNGSKYWLIEVTRRCPGDLYSQLIELTTGTNYVENYIRPFIKLPFNLTTHKKKKWVIRHTLSQSFDYTLGSFSFTIPLLIIKWIPISVTGDRVYASPYGRIGIIFTEMNSEKELLETLIIILKRKLYAIN